MKKIISALLIALASLVFLGSCSEPVILQEFINEAAQNGYWDLSGEEIVNSTGWSFFNPMNDDTDLDSDRLRYKNSVIEKLLNCKLIDDYDHIEENSSYYYQLYAAGDYRFNISTQYGTPNPISDMYKAGLIEPLDYISYIDLMDAEHYGTVRARQHVMFDGLTYAYTGGGDGGAGSGFLIYNSDFIKKFAQTNPQEYYETGKWTFDTFETLLPAVTDLSTETNLIYGLSVYCDKQMLPFCAVFANGGQVVKNEDGYYRFALGDADASEALIWVKELEAQGTVLHDVWEPLAFYNGHSTFYLTRDWSASKALNEESAVKMFEWIPFPYGPRAEYGVTSASYSSEAGGVVILKGRDEDTSGYVLNVWITYDVQYPDGLEINEDEYKLRNNFFTTESYEHFKYASSEEFNYDYFTQLGRDTYDKIAEALDDAMLGSRSLTEAITSVSDMAQTALDDSLNN